jgi:formamidopyrimidine-DNA glycosylase
MPELPDVEVYRQALAERIVGTRLLRVDVLNPFLVRTAVPPLDAANDKRVVSLHRLGKRFTSSSI